MDAPPAGQVQFLEQDAIEEAAMSRHRPEFPDRMTPAAWAWLVALTALSAALRVYALGRHSLWYDEAHTLYLTRYLAHPLSLFRIENNIEAPLIATLTWAWSGIVDRFTDFPTISEQHDFLLRLLPCFSSVLCVPLAFVVARRLFLNTLAGLCAAFLCAVSPFQVYYAQELRVYSTYTAIALLATYFLIRVYEEERHRDFLALAALEVLLMYTHFFSVWAIFCFNLFILLLLPFQRTLFLRWTLYQLGVLVLILPMLWMAWKMDREMSLAKYGYFDPPTWKTPLLTFKAFFAGYGFVPWAYHVLNALGLALVALGFFVLRLRPKALLLGGILLIVPIVACAVIWHYHTYSFYEHRLFIFSGAVAYLLAGLGLAMLPKPFRVIAIALIAVYSAPLLQDVYNGRTHEIDAHVQGIQDKVDLRAAAKYIDTHWRKDDLLVHTSLFTTYPMLHYLPDRAQRHLCATEAEEIDYPLGTRNEPLFRNHGVLPVQYEKVLPQYARFWVLFPDPERRTFYAAPLQDTLDDVLLPLDQQTFDGIHVFLFEKAPQPVETVPAAPPAVEVLEEVAVP